MTTIYGPRCPLSKRPLNIITHSLTLRMTDICVKIYRCHLLYVRKFAVVVVVVAVIVVTYLHK